MTIKETIETIKKVKKIQYADCINADEEGNVYVAIYFNDKSNMDLFSFAWAQSIRNLTDDNFVLRLNYMLPTGEIQPQLRSFKAHSANRGIDNDSLGEPRVKIRRSFGAKMNRINFLTPEIIKSKSIKFADSNIIFPIQDDEQ